MGWLIPREHGAYGQLGFPLVAALAAGRPTLSAILLVVAVTAAFIAHEPGLILLGGRGVRAGRELRGQAVRALLWSSVIAIVSGLAGAWLLPPDLRWTILVPALLAVAAIPMVVRGAQKTLPGEMHVALTLTSCALPVGAAAGLRPEQGAACWAVFALGFWAATLAVHAVIAVQRRESALVPRAGATAVALVSPLVMFVLAARLNLHPLIWVATLPLSLLGILLAVAPPSARHLRRVGWALIAASAAATVFFVALVRV